MKNVLSAIAFNKTQIPKYLELLDVYEGNLNYYVKQSLSKELSPESYTVASTRIPSINLLRRIVKKLSKVYTDEPNRTTADPKDQEIINEYISSTHIQQSMSSAEEILNLQKCVALEPYVKDGEMRLRVLSPHEFMVFSEDRHDPSNVTHFVKYMGTYEKTIDHKVYLSNIYHIFTNQYMFIVDSDGDLLESLPNIYGTIPFIYINSSPFTLMPPPDSDSFDNALLAPKLLCDLAYATSFQSHGIMYGINVEMQGKSTTAPDAFWNLSAKQDGTGTAPSVGVLSPSVDTEKVLALIAFFTAQWLQSRGITPGAMGALNTGNAASAISKVVDEADTIQVINQNRLILVEAEEELWELIGIIHNTLLGSEALPYATTGLSEDLEVSITFPIQLPIVDPTAMRDDLKFKLDNKLTSYFRALKEANPNMSDDEVYALKAEIEAEQTDVKALPIVEPKEKKKKVSEKTIL